MTARYRQPWISPRAALRPQRSSMAGTGSPTPRASVIQRPTPFCRLVDDLNTPLAISEMDALAAGARGGNAEAAGALSAGSAILGLLARRAALVSRGGQWRCAGRRVIEAMISERLAARNAKDFARADNSRRAEDARRAARGRPRRPPLGQERKPCGAGDGGRYLLVCKGSHSRSRTLVQPRRSGDRDGRRFRSGVPYGLGWFSAARRSLFRSSRSCRLSGRPRQRRQWASLLRSLLARRNRRRRLASVGATTKKGASGRGSRR